MTEVTPTTATCHSVESPTRLSPLRSTATASAPTRVPQMPP